jgi:hypothetical protein
MCQSSAFSPFRLFPDTFCGVDMPVQRDFGDLERPAYLRNRVSLLIERLGKTELPGS